MGFMRDLFSDMVVDKDEELKKATEDLKYQHIDLDEFARRLHNVGFTEGEVILKSIKIVSSLMKDK